MDIVVLPERVVIVTGSSKIPFRISKHFKLFSHHHSHSDIKLPPLEKQRLLDIFLHDSVRVGRLVVHEALDLLKSPADFDASALVAVCRLE